ncbi:argininosuccinate synthase, chloroplastic-like [Alnus glutinosa]|uniref:argininosuccinate synthase, chloroplastic-like n=1 Tax=Alnus glutinosa TaxID=3517 RepID=UPI002D76DD98|nr:argininosuccinate synthase, chloroplastic-like [Alnus glutinosa]
MHPPLIPCRYVEIGVESGLPVSVNGKRLSSASLLNELNNYKIGGTILFTVVRELESLAIDRETMQVKDSLALKYAELLYAGRWFDPLCESLDKFMEKITECTTGSVELKLYTEITQNHVSVKVMQSALPVHQSENALPNLDCWRSWG